MFQLTYHSKAELNLLNTDLENILKVATFNNEIHNVTGCLIYYKGNFIQILEGDRKSVIETYNTVKRDSRHNTVQLLWDCDVAKRYFDGWNMAYYNPDANDEKQFEANLLLLSSLSEKNSSSLISFWATVAKVVNGKNIL